MFYFFLEHDTNPDKPKYRPPFLDHFDRKKIDAMNSVATTPAEYEQKLNNSTTSQTPTTPTAVQQPSMPLNSVQSPNSNKQQQIDLNQQQHLQMQPPTAPIDSDRQRYQSHLQLQLNQISAANQMGMQHMMHHAAGIGGGGVGGGGIDQIIPQRQPLDVMKYPRNFVDGEFEFVCIIITHLLNELLNSIFLMNLFFEKKFTVKILKF